LFLAQHSTSQDVTPGKIDGRGKTLRTKASIAAETERLRTVATETENAANAADAAGQYDTADALFAKVGATRDRLNWLHQRG
jgi:hypothetical protein